MMALERDLDMVLVTGAGASTTLGAGSRLPMMGEWCDALSQKLVEKNYLGALPLSHSSARRLSASCRNKSLA